VSGLSGRLLRKLLPTFLDASKLFKWNWGIPQFHKRLRVLRIMPHWWTQHIAASLFLVWRTNERYSICLLKACSIRPLVRRFLLQGERRSSPRRCSPSVASANSFETTLDFPLVVGAGSRNGYIARPMA
jgi:hypothetical protein